MNTACWGKVPAIKAWLDARNMTEDDGYGSFDILLAIYTCC